jgi:AmmeMemoRadiSam system protein B
MGLPAIRYLDAFPVDHEGQRFICLRDPEGIIHDQLLLTPPAFFIACHLDGKNGIIDIQYAFAQQFGGQLLMAADVQSIVTTLDGHGFLLTERFASLHTQIEVAFANAETRPAYLAGKSYPDQPGPLRAFLEAFFAHNNGPGERPATRSGDSRPVRCLIAPHIDFHRGGPAYAHAYLRLFKHGQPATVFLFGVAHAAPPVPFVLTQKHFETPFGVLETDQDIVHRLASVCAWDPYAYEITHRTEHSIEFQAVMLSYLYGSSVRIVPILCGAFGPEVTPAAVPKNVETFLDMCRDLIASATQPISVIAGADLAHVGRCFGDHFDINETIIRQVAMRDREALQYVACGDAEGFYQSVMQDQNQRRVCGLNCIYAALKAVDGTIDNGHLLHYDYAHDPAGGIVSFASVCFP